MSDLSGVLATVEDLTVFRDYLLSNLNLSRQTMRHNGSMVPIEPLSLTHVISGESTKYRLYTAHLGHADDTSLYVDMFDSDGKLITITCRPGVSFIEEDTFVVFGDYQYMFL